MKGKDALLAGLLLGLLTLGCFAGSASASTVCTCGARHSTTRPSYGERNLIDVWTSDGSVLHQGQDAAQHRRHGRPSGGCSVVRQPRHLPGEPQPFDQRGRRQRLRAHPQHQLQGAGHRPHHGRHRQRPPAEDRPATRFPTGTSCASTAAPATTRSSAPARPTTPAAATRSTSRSAGAATTAPRVSATRSRPTP